MAEPFIGEIRIFAGTYAPENWALCDGQLLSIAKYSDLFSLLSVMYGGNGITNFGVPDLRGRVPIHAGSGIGLSPRPQGWKGGTEQVYLQTTHLPDHNHAFQASNKPATGNTPTNQVLADTGTSLFYENIDGDEIIEQLSPQALLEAGQGQPHSNMMPSLGLNFIIALRGVFPARS